MFYEDYNMYQDNINIHQIKEDSFQIDSPRMPSLKEEIQIVQKEKSTYHSDSLQNNLMNTPKKQFKSFNLDES